MRVVVLGGGAVGSLLAAFLARAGHDVLLVGSAEHVRAIREGGLRVEGSLEGRWKVAAEERGVGELTGDRVLLTVKAFDVGKAVEELARRLVRPVPILLPQNGLGIEATAARTLAAVGGKAASSPLVRAINTLPVTLVAPGRVRFTGSGEIRLPEPKGSSSDASAVRGFYELFESAGVPVRYVAEFDRALWTKAVVNGAINPVTAAYGITNGGLTEPPYRALAEALLREGVSAARSAGEDLDGATVREELWRIVAATQGNRSSMLQDVDRGRATEIDVISGALLRAGATHGVRMPETEAIVARVRARLLRAEKSS